MNVDKKIKIKIPKNFLEELELNSADNMSINIAIKDNTIVEVCASSQEKITEAKEIFISPTHRKLVQLGRAYRLNVVESMIFVLPDTGDTKIQEPQNKGYIKIPDEIIRGTKAGKNEFFTVFASSSYDYILIDSIR